MIIWPLFLSLISWAQDNTWDEFCFSTPSKMLGAFEKTKFILIPADKTRTQASCFMINTYSHRRELIENYIKKIDPSVFTKIAHQDTSSTPCLLKIEKMKVLEGNESSINIGPTAPFLPKDKESRKELKETTSINTLSEFELFINENKIKGRCHPQTPDLYKIDLELHESSGEKKALELRRGERVELSALFKDEDKDRAENRPNFESSLAQIELFRDEKVYIEQDTPDASP
jgi:hypothetical protein